MRASTSKKNSYRPNTIVLSFIVVPVSFYFFILLLVVVVFVCLLCCCLCCCFCLFVSLLACLFGWLVVFCLFGWLVVLLCFCFFNLYYLLVLFCSSTSSQSLVLTDIEITHSPSSVPYPLLPYCAES